MDTINTAPSVKALLQITGMTPETAARIRLAWTQWDREKLLAECPKTACWHNSCHHEPELRNVRREAINELAETHGVELLGIHHRSGEYVEYCNAGDTCSTTILFHGSRMFVGCWGDLVERNSINTNQEQIQRSFYS